MRGIVDLSFSLRRLPWISCQSRCPRSFLDALVTLDAISSLGPFVASIGISSLPVARITSVFAIHCIFFIILVLLQWTYRNCRLPDYPRLVKSESVFFTAFCGLAM